MPDHLYAKLGQLTRLFQDQRPGDHFSTALHEAGTLIGADLLVVRVPKEVCDRVELRWPPNAAWPTARMLARWHTRVARVAAPVRLDVGARTSRVSWKHAIAIPLFTATGHTGMVVAFSRSRPLHSREQCYALALLVQSALARAEVAHLRAQSEARASIEVHDRLAREIHDGPLQMLSGTLLHVRLAGRGVDPRSRNALSKLEGQLRQAVAETRALIRRLRVAQPEASLEERLRYALTRLQQARGVSWTMRWREPKDLLTAQAADEVFHVINEALANVYRHSQAKHVNVDGRPHGGRFKVTVRDDGVGFNVADALRRDIRGLSFGLVGMRERMIALGGTVMLRSQPGRGARVTISLPLSQAAPAKSA